MTIGLEQLGVRSWADEARLGDLRLGAAVRMNFHKARLLSQETVRPPIDRLMW